ncbi:hypothetical protein AHF37_00413 [Paragonimus kellicotti]|nr:hypothetical protein AHF37_00413 [Paragonimus kellicotti]
MTSGGSAGLVTMKATAVFPQSSSHLQSQHAPNAALQPNSVLQPSNTFNQQMQQQHLIQQHQQRAQQHAQAHTQQLHRLSQPHSLSSVHPAQTVSVSNNTQPSVFPNAEFFQTLQQTAAALPTVLPYDQSQYIGPLMYFPYPTAAAAAANGLFSSASNSDAQHNTVCSTAQASSTNQLLGTASLVSATPTGMVTLNHAANGSGQVHGTNHLLASGSGLIGLGSGGANSVSATAPTLAPGSLGPLFTTAHFYQQDHTAHPQLHLHHTLQQQQQQHVHSSLQMQQQMHSLTGHSTMHGQTPSTTSVLMSGQVHHSSAGQMNVVNSQSAATQRQLNTSTSSNNAASNTSKVNSASNNSGGGCDAHSKNDDPVHSTPNQTPSKSTDPDLLNPNSHLTHQSQNSNSGLDVSSSSTKRDNNGTGHFVCGVCGREFGMRCRLIAHTRRHTGERPFPCADCGRAFSDRGNLQRHRYTHSSQPRFHCSVCGKSFRQASCLSNHRRFHCAGATGRPCPFCQRSFRSSSSLQMHIRWKHRADAAAAVAAAAAAAASVSGTNDAFSYLPGLSSYVPTASMNGLPAMSLNGVPFLLGLPCPGSLDLQGSSLLSAAAAVAASAAIVNNGGIPGGGGTLGGNTALTTMAVTHASTISASSMLNPLVHGNSPNKRKWRRKPKPKQNAFGRLTGDGMNILAGINLSEGIDVNAAAAAAGAAAAAVGGPVPLDRKGRPCNFPCPACPRRFAFQCRLAAHLRCHTNIRPFICLDCGRAFTQRGYLVRHAAVHKLDRPFSCGLCDRSYKHYGSLVNHKRTHSKLGASGLGNLALLSGTGMDHLGCGLSTTTITGLSSLEEVVGGTVSHSEKMDGSGIITTSAPTITLLPVTKVEEILPGDLGGSVRQICLPSLTCPPNNALGIPDRHQSDAESHGQTHSLPHQLTATAVWPILAHSGAQQPQMLASANVSQIRSMASSSHFPTLTISPQGVQSGQQNPQHQLSILPPQRQPANSNNLSMLSTAATPAFVTMPLFGSQSQTVANDVAISAHHTTHHSFHNATSSLVNTTAVSDSSRTSRMHPVQQTAQLSVPQQQSAAGADVNTTPVLHVLQPSPSIFFSPYYLPHSAASQM